jgi:hypothetical protein
MKTDQRLEELSDLVRQGTPINFMDAFAVIEYQTNLPPKQKTGIIAWMKKYFTNLLK